MVSEAVYADYVETVFAHRFPDATIEREVYTPSERFCDIVVESKYFTYVIEVENTSDDVVTNGVGQALLYATEFDGIPIIVFPPDGDNEAELNALSNYVTILPLSIQEY
jgi:hypothetical protein